MEGDPMTMSNFKPNARNSVVQRWLAAEERGELSLAERYLTALLALLPAVRPAEGFSDRVLNRLAEEAVASRRRRVPLELLAAMLFLGTGLALRLAPYWLTPLMSRVALPTWPARLWDAASGAGAALVELLEAAVGSLHLSQLILTSPQGMTFVAACIAVALISVRFLYALLERSSDDV